MRIDELSFEELEKKHRFSAKFICVYLMFHLFLVICSFILGYSIDPFVSILALTMSVGVYLVLFLQSYHYESLLIYMKKKEKE
jgi:NADH:ubiquinone oxidoreductase subunit 3 (subunit A)